MIGYVMVGTNNMDKAAAFYDALLAEMGGKRIMEEDSYIAWANKPDHAGFCITKPFDKKPASVGNGVMVALAVDSSALVNKMHSKAISLGAKDEGAPGPRGDSGFYAGYFRDLDGNKLNVFCIVHK